MSPSPSKPAAAAASWFEHPLARLGEVLVLLYVFLVGVNGLSKGFQALGGGLLDSFFTATDDPFMGLMVGILATTLVQSSSVTTAMIVGFVAAPDNPLPIVNAVPMIMGANIGTTVTNTIAALAHMGRKEEFRRAFAVATCHDFFNYLAVFILLPLELLTGVLQKTATALVSLVGGFGGAEYDSPIKGAIKAGSAPIKSVIDAVIPSAGFAAVVYIVVSGILIFAALRFEKLGQLIVGDYDGVAWFCAGSGHPGGELAPGPTQPPHHSAVRRFARSHARQLCVAAEQLLCERRSRPANGAHNLRRHEFDAESCLSAVDGGRGPRRIPQSQRTYRIANTNSSLRGGRRSPPSHERPVSSRCRISPVRPRRSGGTGAGPAGSHARRLVSTRPRSPLTSSQWCASRSIGA